MREQFCEWCLGDFNDLPPVYVDGYMDWTAHRPGDKDDIGCAEELAWSEVGRWVTNRGSQGARKWPDGTDWVPEPWTDEPTEES